VKTGRKEHHARIKPIYFDVSDCTGGFHGVDLFILKGGKNNMNSQEMLKVTLKEDEYFHNQAELGKEADWIILKKHDGYLLTQKQYDKLIKGGTK